MTARALLALRRHHEHIRERRHRLVQRAQALGMHAIVIGEQDKRPITHDIPRARARARHGPFAKHKCETRRSGGPAGSYFRDGRGDWIRTSDPQTPSLVR